MHAQPDVIEVKDLEISARVGVPDDERAAVQRLTVSVVLMPRRSFADLQDDLAQTIDYAAVCDALQQLASSRETRLIETLADGMASHLLARFPLLRVELELRKYILPQTKYVAVRVVRGAGGAAQS